MNQDDLYEFFFRNREFKMFNEIIEITEITWNQTDFNEIKWFWNLVQDFLKCRTPRSMHIICFTVANLPMTEESIVY